MAAFTEIALSSSYRYTIGRAVDYKKLFALAPKYDLLDRLYRRYVRFEDIEPTRDLIKRIFDGLSFDKKLRESFEQAYAKCVEDVEEDSGKNGELYGRGAGKICPPIRIVNVTGINSDTSPNPDYMWYLSAESFIPLKDYDTHDHIPFWMMRDQVIQKYLLE